MTIEEIKTAYRLDKEDRLMLDQYLENPFNLEHQNLAVQDDFADQWLPILDYAGITSGADALQKYLIPKDYPVAFRQPDRITLEMYHTETGRLPIIVLGDKGDFEEFVTSVIYRGTAPAGLGSTGAAFAFGKTNRFMVLSCKPYSNIPAHEMGLDAAAWLQKSMVIRTEHEAAHYFTKQVLGVSRNHLHDELIADFFGIYAAFGEYRAEWFLRLIGVIGASGTRLQFYIKGLAPSLAPVISRIAEQAAAFLEVWSNSEEFHAMTKAERMLYLCGTSLTDMHC